MIEINQRSRHVRLNPKEPEFYKNPYPLYDLIREQVPVFFWEDYQMWCFAAHADVNAILRDRRFGRQITHLDRKIKLPKVSPELQPLKDVYKYSMLEMEPPAHTRLRGLVHKAFMARQIEQMRPRIERLCHELIDRMIARGPGDLLDIYAVPIPVIIIAEMLGVPTEMADQLLDWSHAIVKTYQIGHTEEESALALQAAIDFTDYLKELVVERRSNPKDDLITRLIEVRDAGEKLTEKELISNCILLLNAGHEATVNLTGNGVYALLSNPEQLADLKSDPAIIPTAIEELFRFDTPLHYFERWVLEDLEIAGQKFPFGSKIAVLLGAANRDPAVFPEPNRLLLRRANNLHVSFGGGIHYCLGAPLARLELNISIPLLFERLPNLSLMEEPVFMNSYHFRGLETLKVDW